MMSFDEFIFNHQDDMGLLIGIDELFELATGDEMLETTPRFKKDIMTIVYKEYVARKRAEADAKDTNTYAKSQQRHGRY